MGNHRGGARRKKTDSPAHIQLRHRDAPQRPTPKSPTPSSDSINTDDTLSLSTQSSSESSSPDSIKHTEDSTNTPNDSLRVSKTKIPPIILNPDQWKTSAPKIMHKYTSEQLHATFSNNSFRLQASDSDIFRDVQRTLAELDINFHTFSLPSERTLKVLLRGIPNFYSEDEVKIDLEILGFNTTHVRQFFKEGRKLPMYMVNLPCTTNSKEIFNLDSLFYVRIKVEPYKNTGPAQCFACQGFGHSSSHCNHPARCVKCGDNHTTKSCTKTPDQPPRCCNCNGEHTANYRKCPAYTKAASLKSKHPQELQPAPTPQASTIKPTSPNYAQACSSPKTVQSPPASNTNKTNTDVIEILNHAIKQIATSSNFKDTILLAISAIVSLINQNE